MEFEWKQDRFNPSMPLKDLVANIYEVSHFHSATDNFFDITSFCVDLKQEAVRTDEDLKAKLTKFSDTKASLAAIERKESYVHKAHQIELVESSRVLAHEFIMVSIRLRGEI
jgi:hypothetical protein